jgi:poly-gamma-glutamate system protein
MSALATMLQQLWKGEASRQPHVHWRWLVLAAVGSIALWQATEFGLQRTAHPQQRLLLAAAETAARAQQEIARVKQSRGLLQPTSVDPNRTGLIGPEWSEIVTTIGDLTAKRTVTNPDFAAALARVLLSQRLPQGGAVALVLSGSFVGANIAAISAVEALGLRPVVVSSIGASMYGATDPEFTWLDMEAVVERAGIWKARSIATVLGGESALGNSLTETGRDMLAAAAHRNGSQPLRAQDFATLKREVHSALRTAAPAGIVALISSGGSVLSMGTCEDAYRLPTGLVRGRLSCLNGVPGLNHDYAEQGVPVIHILNVRRLALEWGLPYDPVPLPVIGTNAKIYGRTPSP